MMVNRSKNIGTQGETAVVRYLRANGWPNAERRALAGNSDLGDVVGTPGICWEVKAGKAAETCTDGDLATWTAQTDAETRNSKAELGVLVCKRKGVGSVNVGSWWAWMRVSALVDLHPFGLGVPEHERPEVIDTWVRMTLREACWFLRQAGYGSPLPSSNPDEAA